MILISFFRLKSFTLEFEIQNEPSLRFMWTARIVYHVLKVK